jgi:hypothetical protein
LLATSPSGEGTRNGCGNAEKFAFLVCIEHIGSRTAYNPIPMGWTFDEIKTDWLGDGAPVPPEALVAAFDRAEQYLGRDWIETSRRSAQAGVIARGIAPTMSVADMGQKLALLDGVKGNVSKLVRKIQEDPPRPNSPRSIYCARESPRRS